MLLHRRPRGELERLSTPLFLLRCVLRPAIQNDPAVFDALARGKQVVVIILAVAVATARLLVCGLARRRRPDLRSAPLRTGTGTGTGRKDHPSTRANAQQTQQTGRAPPHTESD
eukprot:COSAG02_NODE_29764_length_563_cov_1.150862_1_plen_113_part_01